MKIMGNFNIGFGIRREEVKPGETIVADKDTGRAVEVQKITHKGGLTQFWGTDPDDGHKVVVDSRTRPDGYPDVDRFVKTA